MESLVNKPQIDFQATLKPIENEAAYQAAMKRLREIGDSPYGSPEAREEEILALMLEQYEEEHHPVEPLDPIDYLKIRMEVLGLEPKDLQPYLGDKGTVSKILNRKRPLSLANIRALYKGLHLSLEVLIGEYTLHQSDNSTKADQ